MSAVDLNRAPKGERPWGEGQGAGGFLSFELRKALLGGCRDERMNIRGKAAGEGYWGAEA